MDLLVWFATFLTSVFVNWTAAKTNDRWIHIVVLMLLAAIGNAIATGTTGFGPRYFAMFLMPMGSIASYTILVSWVSISFPRPLVKRSSAIAISNMIGNTATIYGSYMYAQSTGPQYIPGGTANTVISVMVAVLAVVLRYIHKWENKKLEAAEQEAATSEGVVARAEGAPPGFRYIY